MENFGDYLRAGVNMGLGTDTTPHNLVEEMRKAAVLARIAARDIATVTTSDLLHAATIGGAKALMRDDLGRIALNGKADLVLVDLTVPQMRPLRDPLRSFIYHAADRAVCDVFVDGQQVVADRKVLTMHQDDAADRLAGAQEPHVGGSRAAGLSRPQCRSRFLRSAWLWPIDDRLTSVIPAGSARRSPAAAQSRRSSTAAAQDRGRHR